MTNQKYFFDWLDATTQTVLLWRFPEKFIYAEFAQAYHDLVMMMQSSQSDEVTVLVDLSNMHADYEKSLGITNRLSVIVNSKPEKLSQVIFISTSRIVLTVIDIAIQTNPQFARCTTYVNTLKEAYSLAEVNGV